MARTVRFGASLACEARWSIADRRLSGLSGFRPRIVLSVGALGVLHNDELTAVVAHERGHLHERHDLVMLPFASMLPFLSWMPYVGRAPRALATLVEMAADDFATRANEPHLLASALVHLASSDATPRCALAASQTSVAIRVHRSRPTFIGAGRLGG